MQFLSHETGKPVAALLTEALDALQHQVCPNPVNGEAHDHPAKEAHATTDQLEDYNKPFLETFIEASLEIPDEELDRLPTDLAAQVDHYIYGTPKRPA